MEATCAFKSRNIVVEVTSAFGTGDRIDRRPEHCHHNMASMRLNNSGAKLMTLKDWYGLTKSPGCQKGEFGASSQILCGSRKYKHRFSIN